MRSTGPGPRGSHSGRLLFRFSSRERIEWLVPGVSLGVWRFRRRLAAHSLFLTTVPLKEAFVEGLRSRSAGAFSISNP